MAAGQPAVERRPVPALPPSPIDPGQAASEHDAPNLKVREVAVDIVVLRMATCGGSLPLLLVHGIGGNLEMWAALVRHLPCRRLVMFDSPVTGGSLPLPGPRRMPEPAELVLGLLDALDLGQVDVLGYSSSGALAQELAYRAPARARSLVLAATVPGVFGQPPPAVGVRGQPTPVR